MKLAMRLTLDGLVRALRSEAHAIVEDLDVSRTGRLTQTTRRGLDRSRVTGTAPRRTPDGVEHGRLADDIGQS